MSAFKDHFSSHAAAYAAYRPAYPPALAAWLGTVAPAPKTALDVGCGSGQLSLQLAEHFDRVIATDPSAQQIASATPHPRVDYRVAPAEASDLPDGSVDLITAAQAAHWFDLPAFFAETKRLLRPDGIVALITYAGMEPQGEIEAIVERFRVETLAEHWPPERALVENDYRDIHLPFARIEAPAFSIEVRWPLAALIGYLDTWSAVRALEHSTGRAPFDAVAADLARAWGDPAAIRTIRWPLTILAGRHS
ncbi:methyltransferase domain-containing protein [Sphingomonas histidinilytica]|uniref:Methyltransferase domain-containing protein n=1 Tax=Rhizorhabdus histidinilytica TaxID=439228 RepID=A0A1T5CLZ2_9SPHN|nr:class I SAM-dependent methyltransferase [Rhizorhabdus histidinilytica]MBO9380569.1 methyltransferase domain-containing protein [Rhizorhabdus histidinilytica]QEH78941.1 class I SAM-dependent methyltransferase [Sphingomonas sp. C8-2]SKB60518.1 Methyltransferase domain-containing protein [Rhizorhabdus histidinilytica]